MAGRYDHCVAGAISGGALAFHYAADLGERERLLETIGGCLFGILGARLPDIFDPPTSPNHRGAAHSAGAAICSIGKVQAGIAAWQETLRAFAEDEMQAARLNAGRPEERGHLFVGTLLSLAAGAIPGLVAGYASHLVLDALTPKGLPLIA